MTTYIDMSHSISASILKEKNTLKDTIDLMKFLLAVLIVVLHTDFSSLNLRNVGYGDISETFPLFYKLEDLFSHYVASIAVPLFFFISGFLFFLGVKKFKKETYVCKLQRRTKSLVIPYVIWNTIYLLIFLMAQLLIPSMMSGDNKAILDYNVFDILIAYTIHPIDGPLWFVRDLFIMVMITPILWILLSRLKVFVPIILLSLYLFGIISDGIIFFVFGAFFKIFDINFISISRNTFKLSLSVSLILAILYILMPEIWGVSMTHFSKIININSFIACCSLLVAKFSGNPIKPTIVASNFFIYAYHKMPLLLVMKLLLKYIHPDNDFLFCICYITSIAIIGITGVYIYICLFKFFPKTTAILCGGR